VAAAPRGKSTVDGGLRWREWTNGAAEGRGRGGALRRRGFVKEEEMCDGALGCPYVEAKREEGREWGPRLRHVEEERGWVPAGAQWRR
jgi:hypothetical protein